EQVSGSASVIGDVLTLTLVNTSATEAAEAALRLHGGARLESIDGAHLSYPSGDIHAHNTFDTPNAVIVQEGVEDVADKAVSTIRLPAASITRLTLGIA